MAEGDISVYNNFKEQLLLGLIDLDGHTFKVMLVNGYVFSADGSPGYADVSGDEISAANYVAGGATLGSLAVDQDDALDNAAWDAGNVTWGSLGAASIDGAIIYDDSHASKALVAYIEIGTNSNGGDYTISWNADGILELS